MRADLLITGGTLVDAGRQYRGDVAIADGRIIAISAPGTEIEAARTIDASGRHVLPGLIDAHVHFGFGEAITEYTTETIYAAQGGFTTVLGHLMSAQPYGPIFEREMGYAAPRAHVDFGFHFTTTTAAQLAELDRYVANCGVTSFKYFMNLRGEEGRYMGLDGTDDAYLFRLLERAAAIGPLMLTIHTENIEVVNHFRGIAMERGLETLKDWSRVKPPFTEAESCIRAMYFAEQLGARIYIVHLSTRLALDEVRRWRDRYDQVFVETCPHYLTHTEDSALGGMGKANPPFRSADDVEAMWEGLADGSIDVVASDHVPRKRATKEVSLWKASQGFPGTATILPVLLDRGYHQGRLSIERIAQLLTSRPADLFGLPQKGRLKIGLDGDVTIVDLERVATVDPAALGSYSDYSLYEGQSFRGWPVMTIVRGQVVMDNGVIVGPAGFGRYLPRQICESATGRR
jgi:dihydropyrimidinase